MILYANDVRDPLPLFILFRGNIAQANVPNETLALHRHKCRQRFGDGALGRRKQPTHAQVHQVQGLKLQVAEVVLH